jgi:hypothetical protein
MLLQFPVPVPPEPGVVQVFQQVVIPILGMGLAAFLGFGVFRMIGKAFERKSLDESSRAALDVLREEVERQRVQLEGVEQLRGRLEEVEERLDFTERVLTQRTERQLPGAGG